MYRRIYLLRYGLGGLLRLPLSILQVRGTGRPIYRPISS
jgi:hypothetical protein